MVVVVVELLLVTLLLVVVVVVVVVAVVVVVVPSARQCELQKTTSPHFPGHASGRKAGHISVRGSFFTNPSFADTMDLTVGVERGECDMWPAVVCAAQRSCWIVSVKEWGVVPVWHAVGLS